MLPGIAMVTVLAYATNRFHDHIAYNKNILLTKCSTKLDQINCKVIVNVKLYIVSFYFVQIYGNNLLPTLPIGRS